MKLFKPDYVPPNRIRSQTWWSDADVPGPKSWMSNISKKQAIGIGVAGIGVALMAVSFYRHRTTDESMDLLDRSMS